MILSCSYCSSLNAFEPTAPASQGLRLNSDVGAHESEMFCFLLLAVSMNSYSGTLAKSAYTEALFVSKHSVINECQKSRAGAVTASVTQSHENDLCLRTYP